MKRFILTSVLSLILCSCEKELDFKYHEVESQFVIEGTLTGKGAKVVLSYTVPMAESITNDIIEDAEIILTDLNDNISYSLFPNQGIFYADIKGFPSHNYELSVKHKDSYYKSSCVMRNGVEIIDLKFQWIKMPYDYVAVLEIVSTVSEIKDTCYWTRIYKNGNPYKWLMSHGSGSINGELNQSVFTTRLNPDDENDKRTLKEGDVLTVSVAPISLEMYDYLVGISSDSNGPSMFSGDFCLGYFMAAEEAESFIEFRPKDYPNYP